MTTVPKNPFRTAVSYLCIALLAGTSFAFGQNSSSGGGWRRVGDPPPPAPTQASPAPDPNYSSNQNNNGYPADQSGDPNQSNQAPAGPPPQGPPPNNGSYGPPPNYQQPNYNQPGYNQPNQPPAQIPPQLTIPAGTFITARVNQVLSSDKNQAGDAFSATLVQPIVVNGIVIAEPGQTLGGRVAEAQKAGHIEGVARLGIQLTTLTLVDGQQLPIQCQLVSRKGPTSVGQDAGTIAGTTALGAAIGAAADWGRGAAIGAGAGAAAGIIGVLVTRGHPSVIYPEQILTFKLDLPLTISTTYAPQAFRYIQPNEYDRPYYSGQQGPGPGAYPAPAPGYAYDPYYYAYGYPYYGYPYYWGPSFSVFWGPRFYGRGWYGGYRGFYGGRYYSGRGYVSAGAGHFSAGAVGHASGGRR